jgi:hypothetical protein
MNYDSKQLALAYHREFFSSLYDLELDKDRGLGSTEAPTACHLTPDLGCGTLEGRATLPPPRLLHSVTSRL